MAIPSDTDRCEECGNLIFDEVGCDICGNSICINCIDDHLEEYHGTGGDEL